VSPQRWLPVRIGFDQTGIDREAFAAHQTFGHAPAHNRLEDMT
jgi:hypothetical protein